MKRLFLLLIFSVTVCVAQVKTHATFYNYEFQDTIMKGDCYFDVNIDEDTICLHTQPPLVLIIQSREPEKNGVLKMYAVDNEGIRCIVRMLVTSQQKEISVGYQNVELGYILE